MFLFQIFFLFLFFFFFFKGKYDLLFVLFYISLISDTLKFDLGFKLQLYYVAPILFLPKSIKNIYFLNKKSELKYYFINNVYLILIAILLGILFPWESSGIKDRLWSQYSEGRALIQIIRLLFDVTTVLYIFYLIKNLKYDIKKFNKLITHATILVLIIGLLDFLLFHSYFKTLIVGYELNINRFTAFAGEPRFLGRSLVYTLGILLIFNFYYNEKSKYSFFIFTFLQISIFLTLSASSFIIEIIFLITFFFLYSFKKFIKYFIFIIIIVISTFYYFFINDLNNTQSEVTYKKIQLLINISDGNALSEVNENTDEPNIFKKLEVFDRAAANYLFNNPIYIITGVGPNLISIPASEYLDETSKLIYGNRIDSVPHTGLLNIISSGGIISFFLYFIFIFKNKSLKFIKILIPFFIIFLLVSDILFLIIISLFTSFNILNKKYIKQLDYDIN